MEKRELLEEGDSMSASHQPDSSALSAAQADFLRHKADSRRERGEAQCRAGNLVKGLTLFHLALDTYRSIDDHFNEAYTLQEIGDVHFQLEQLPQALTAYHSALDLYRPLADPLYEAVTLRCIGSTLFSLGQLDSALETYQQAIERFQADDNGPGIADTWISISQVHLCQAHLQLACAALEKAQLLRRAVPDPYDEGLDTLSFARFLRAAGYSAEALTYARQARRLFVICDAPDEIIQADRLLQSLEP
jgi:tetratricopeptide (TPR) repeat protein